MDKQLSKSIEYLRKSIHLVWMLYLFALVGIFPLYLDLRTGYQKIDVDKFHFFKVTSLWTVGCFIILLFCGALLHLIKWYKNRGCISLAPGILLVRSMQRLSYTDLFVLFYAFSLLISYGLSSYCQTASIGAEGWYMGLFPQLMFVGIYLITSRLLTSKEIRLLGYTMLAASFLVFLLAILNRYGIDPLKTGLGDPGFLSTIGNINWLCGYWSTVFPLGCGLFWLKQRKAFESSLIYSLKWVFLGLYIAVGISAAITQGSESGVFTLISLILLMGWIAGKNHLQFISFFKLLFFFSTTLILLQIVHLFLPDANTLPTPLYNRLMGTFSVWVIAGLIFVFLFFLQSKLWGQKSFFFLNKVWKGGVVLATLFLILYVILVIANTLNPGVLGSFSNYPAFWFDENWGNARGGTWKAGLSTWLSQDLLHKLTGAGPDAMSAYIYSGKNSALLHSVLNQFGQHTLTNAHNEWITVLADLGLLGLFSFIGMMISSIIRFVKSRKPWCIAFAFCLLSYTINNMFSFQQLMNISQMFVLLGMGEAIARKIQ